MERLCRTPLKAKYPNKLDWSYFDQMQSGLKLANTPGEKLNVLGAFANKLTNDVQTIQTNQQTSQLETEMASLKAQFPKRLNWAYFDQMQSGLKLANTPQERQNIINAFSEKLGTDVQTLENAAQTKQEQKSTPPPSPQAHKTFWTNPDGSKTAPQKKKSSLVPSRQAHKTFWTNPDGSPSSTPPKGSGFQPLSWNPYLINGSFPDENKKVVIHG